MTSDDLDSDADFKSRLEKASGDGLTPSQPGLPQVFSHSTLGLDFQLGRALGAAPYGGSDIGECFATAPQGTRQRPGQLGGRVARGRRPGRGHRL